MQPWFAAATLAVLMCFTLTCYFFRIPDDLRHGGPGGRWGPPNAEFNWCERDYELVDWMAEPVNTISCLALILPPVSFLMAHDVASDVALMAVLVVVIGIGSALFHGSLRYSMQLMDELPMLWYSFTGAASLMRRVRGVELTWPAMAFVAVLTPTILLTEQHSPLHEVSRGLMSCSFSACIIAMAWGSTAIVSRLKEELTDKRRHVPVSAERLHTAAFVMFVLAVMCWLLDNYFCPALSRLPLGLPYPHFHMWWHVLSAAVLYALLLVLHLDDLRAEPSTSITYRFGLLPQVTSA